MLFKEHKMKQMPKDLKDLKQSLDKMTDYRRAQGKRHKISTVVLITIFAILSNYHGLNAIGDFIKKNKEPLLKILKVKRLPSISTARRVLMNIEWEELKELLETWILKRLNICSGTWISLDGKAICGTGSGKHDEITLVSMFITNKKIAMMTEKVIDKSNEIPIVQEMISLFNAKNIFFIADAMHCQKKTARKIAIQGNFYVLQVKKNQKKLYKKARFIGEYISPISIESISEKNRGRFETRTASVHKLSLDLEYDGWKDIKCVVCVKRTTVDKGQTSEEIAYFISNANLNATAFNKGIREHWLIENSLHYIKDVTLREDYLKITSGNAPQNISLLRTFALNLLRRGGFKFIASAIRIISSNFDAIFKLFAVKKEPSSI